MQLLELLDGKRPSDNGIRPRPVASPLAEHHQPADLAATAFDRREWDHSPPVTRNRRRTARTAPSAALRPWRCSAGTARPSRHGRRAQGDHPSSTSDWTSWGTTHNLGRPTYLDWL
ncbi:hypothetical protein ACFWFI_23970 [Streptomyces sp. NPDC060209]|uniref:hypothetical protein n=1 Tax=Streptomyces sp. NPDC060209 TaxID=3347073 RepID=UPI0036665C86